MRPITVRNMRMSGNKPTIGLSWAPKVPPLSSGTKNSSEKSECLPQNTAYKHNAELVDGLFVPPRDPRKLNKMLKKQVKDTTGKSWFDMPAPNITPEIKKDLQILKLRSVIDPKRHYKKGDPKALPKYFQVGTVIESPSDFFSGRLTKKERKATLAEELLSDRSLGDYRKRKVREIEDQHRSVGVEKWKIKGRQTMKRAKQRRH
ncbi:rRNA-processing protein fcf2-like isoform X2 [Tasmannia lanceolata]|uniref:rRNA-processing protein fcf2-like isoform X2 n=1 Tax=Tasmannia lanceolata TaxID=3420 RepID=UPI004062DC0A